MISKGFPTKNVKLSPCPLPWCGAPCHCLVAEKNVDGARTQYSVQCSKCEYWTRKWVNDADMAIKSHEDFCRIVHIGKAALEENDEPE